MVSYTPPTVRGPDLGHLTDLCPRGLVGFAVNAKDERPDDPERLQALLDWADRARRGAVVFSVCVSCLRPVLRVDLTGPGLDCGAARRSRPSRSLIKSATYSTVASNPAHLGDVYPNLIWANIARAISQLSSAGGGINSSTDTYCNESRRAVASTSFPIEPSSRNSS